MTDTDILTALKVVAATPHARATLAEVVGAIKEIETLRTAVQIAKASMERAEKERMAMGDRLEHIQRELLRLSGAEL